MLVVGVGSLEALEFELLLSDHLQETILSRAVSYLVTYHIKVWCFVPHELLAPPLALDATRPGWVLCGDEDHPSKENQREAADSQSGDPIVRWPSRLAMA